jgi:L-seryl-tRNA(Ser) seleniumtransferase
VHELAAELAAPHSLAVVAAREAIEEHRRGLLAGSAPEEDVAASARRHLDALRTPSLRRALNATGVIVHTGLGRAPLPVAAREAVAVIAAGYSNLELDLATGERGSRHTHVEGLLQRLTGAEAAMVVNNGAAAALLAAAALAAGCAIVVSRGQLVEIGGGFRVPEVIAQSGARLVEVGTTNRTTLEDFRAALAGNADVAAVMRVHPSNFRTLGFTAEVAIEELCELGVPVIDDIGSGVLADTDALPGLAEEPPLRRSVAAGAALVVCSGDKLLGGPQAGLLVGRRSAVDAARRHPLARALRIDKLSLAALEATLRLYLDPAAARRAIPVLAMLDASEAELADRAGRLAAAIGPPAAVMRAVARIGGGALPLLELEGPVVALAVRDPDRLAGALRAGEPAVVARVNEGRLLLDPRTLADDELQLVAASVRAAL